MSFNSKSLSVVAVIVFGTVVALSVLFIYGFDSETEQSWVEEALASYDPSIYEPVTVERPMEEIRFSLAAYDVERDKDKLEQLPASLASYLNAKPGNPALDQIKKKLDDDIPHYGSWIKVKLGNEQYLIRKELDPGFQSFGFSTVFTGQVRVTRLTPLKHKSFRTRHVFSDSPAY